MVLQSQFVCGVWYGSKLSAGLVDKTRVVGVGFVLGMLVWSVLGVVVKCVLRRGNDL